MNPEQHQQYWLWIALFSLIIVISACDQSRKLEQIPVPTPTPPAETSPLHLGWVWSNENQDPLEWLVVGVDGNIYVTDFEGTIYAVAPPGRELWRYHGDYDYILARPILGDGGRLLYIETNPDQKIHAVSTKGELKWVFNKERVQGGSVTAAPDGSIYIRTPARGYNIYPNGTWKIFPWPQGQSYSVFDSQGNQYWPLHRKDEILVLAPDGEVVRRCYEEGRLNWWPVFGAEDALFYSLRGGEIVARDTACKTLWRHSINEGESEDAVYPLVVGTGDVAYAGGENGRIYAFRGTDGKLLWQTEPDPAIGDISYLVMGKTGILFALGSRSILLGINQLGNEVWRETLYDSLEYGYGYLEPTADGGIALIQKDCLKVYTYDASLVVEPPPPVDPPASTTQAKDEIVSFMLEHIQQNARYLEEDWTSRTEKPYDSIITWWPPLEQEPEDTFDEYLNTEKPIRVWWHKDGQLIEREDKQQAIEDYSQQFIVPADVTINAWSSHAFGILSISEDRQEAEIYYVYSCGGTCGAARILTLRRSPEGQWVVVQSVRLWIS